MLVKSFVTVVIPTYNQANFLKLALQSVLDQTYKVWEAIIVNNFSDDNTTEIVKNFNDPRIKIIDYKNYGIIAAGRNRGISISKGEYIAFLDSDDIWYPEKLANCIEYIEKGFDLVCHGEYWVGANSNKRKIFYGPEKKASYRSLLFNGNCISTSATVVRKKALTNVGNFSESSDMVTAEDYELWLKLSKSGIKIGFINKILGEYRIHEGNNSKAVVKHMLAESAVVNKHIKIFGKLSIIDNFLVRRRTALVYYGAGRGFHRNQDYISALKYFFKTWVTYPLIPRLYIATILTLFKFLLS